MLARRVLVHGRVQGVFYRESCRREAERLGVGGWIRNRADGRSVEARLEGDRIALDALAAWMREGPPHADVEVVEIVAEDELDVPSTRFVVR